MNLRALRNRIEALIGRPAPELPANFVDPICVQLRMQIASGATSTPTTPALIEAAKARLRERLARAGQVRA